MNECDNESLIAGQRDFLLTATPLVEFSQRKEFDPQGRRLSEPIFPERKLATTIISQSSRNTVDTEDLHRHLGGSLRMNTPVHSKRKADFRNTHSCQLRSGQLSSCVTFRIPSDLGHIKATPETEFVPRQEPAFQVSLGAVLFHTDASRQLRKWKALFHSSASSPKTTETIAIRNTGWLTEIYLERSHVSNLPPKGFA